MRMRTGALAALLALAACGDEDRTYTGFTASIDKTSTSADDTTGVPAPAVPHPPDTLLEKSPPQVAFAVALGPVASARVRGTGQVKAVGKSTSIAVALAEGVQGATYEGAVRQGSCAGVGASVASLFPVSADSLGNGRASSDVSLPIDSLLGAPHVVVYGRGGRPEACAPLRAGAAPPPARGAQPPASRSAEPYDSAPPPPARDTVRADTARGR